MLVDGVDLVGLRQERAHHGLAVFGMKAEIVERVGMPAFDDRIGLRGQFGHEASWGRGDKIRSIPFNGTRSHSGRWDNSYSTSASIFSSRKKSSIRSAACGSAGHRRVFVMISR